MKNRYPVLLLSFALGCNSGASRSGTPTGNTGGKQDQGFVFPGGDDGGGGGGDDGGGNNLGQCDEDPRCQKVGVGDCLSGMKFPLQSDMPIDPAVANDGVGRDNGGCLALDQTKAAFDFLWAANSGDVNGKGTVSKFNSKTVRETARYYTVTCYSLKGKGNKMMCDGAAGCCAIDSQPQFQNRKGGMPSGPYQQVQQASNAPSRTSVDFNGDMWVSNRAFGGQASVTKIANDISTCIDRNGNGKIETSKDTNGDGVISTDCNGDQQADNIDGVKMKACTNNMPQEFYGEDDECILFTTNTDNKTGRPLTLGPGAQDFGPSDAWAGMYDTGKFYRVDGKTGLIKVEVQLPANDCRPYGAVVDSNGYGWAGNLSGSPKAALCYWNTKNPMEVGSTRTPTVGQEQGYGISLDRDGNIWNACLSFGACRYTPNRKGNFMDLGNGVWTMFSKPGSNNGGGYGIGIAVDSRTAKEYFAWIAGNSHVVQIPASAVPVPAMDTLIDGSAYKVARIAGDGKGVGVDRDQNVWNISGSGTTGATRVLVDAMGNITQPDINSAPMGNNKCPAGDRCPHRGDNPWDPSPYTYSDFTGFGLRNFTKPTGYYRYLFKGCDDMQGSPNSHETKWLKIEFEGDSPPNTSLSTRARTGNTPMPDPSWSPYTPDFTTTPADLQTGMPLMIDAKETGWLEVEVNFKTSDKNKTPKLRRLTVYYVCPNFIP